MFNRNRQRLALGYIAVMTTILVLFGWAVYATMENALMLGIDTSLKDLARTVRHSIPVDRPQSKKQWLAHIERSSYITGDTATQLGYQGYYITWYDPKRSLVRSTAQFQAGSLPERDRYETVASPQGQRFRQYTVPLGREGELLGYLKYEGEVLGYLRISRSLQDIEVPLQRLFWVLVLGIPVAAGAIGWGGWILAGVAIRPIRQAYDRLQQFTADASHELRTPIATIQTNVQVALSDSEANPEDYRRTLEVVERMAQRMGRLVGDLLFLTREDGNGENRSYTKVDLGRILDEVVEEQCSVAAGLGIALHSKINTTSCVLGDGDQLARLFTNLVGNALRYTAQGGEVVAALKAEGRDCVVTISDTGIGIPLEHQDKIFERFYRVDPARSRRLGGFGLGLAIAKKIVEEHRGTLGVQSMEGKGTTFIVHLPNLNPQAPLRKQRGREEM
jgi:two-component system, OmpR family, manganese sensing sensor histidine kinase